LKTTGDLHLDDGGRPHLVQDIADMTAEHQRLREQAESRAPWMRWGPYVSERQWGTVREDYSADGDAWAYFPHEHARSRAYRWVRMGWPASVMTSSGSA